MSLLDIAEAPPISACMRLRAIPPKVFSPCEQWAACHLEKFIRYPAFQRPTWIERVVWEAIPDHEHGIEHPLPNAIDFLSASECDHGT